jgi:endonuclease G
MIRILTLLALLWVSPALSDPLACPGHFFSGQTPEVTRDAGVTRMLCFKAFAVLHSGRFRTPVYSAEHLTKAALGRSKGRHCAFHSEPLLPFNEAAHPGDYLHSGYDRGHMAPDRDMPDTASERESCSLANVVPQNHDLNAGSWKQLEEQVRDMVLERGEIYVVTGPLYERVLFRHAGRVWVPDFVWKAVLDPNSGQTLAAIAENDDSDVVHLVPLDELERRIGMKIFPGLGTKDQPEG